MKPDSWAVSRRCRRSRSPMMRPPVVPGRRAHRVLRRDARPCPLAPAALEWHTHRRIADHEPLDRLAEVAGPPAPPQFAVREDADARLPLQVDHPQDVGVLDLAQRRLVDASTLERLPRLLHLRRPQKTSNVVCAKRAGHGDVSFGDWWCREDSTRGDLRLRS